MQVDTIKLTMKAPVTQMLKLQYDKLLSTSTCATAIRAQRSTRQGRARRPLSILNGGVAVVVDVVAVLAEVPAASSLIHADCPDLMPR